ncbi:MAG: hypothetical protein AAGL98_05620, partial [Planctomycetota bacterium]
ENVGNQTVSNVSVVDPLLPALMCEVAELEPGETLTCTDTYTVTQDDIDSGSLENTATVTGATPQGDTVSDTATFSSTLPEPEPAVEVAKTAAPSPFGAVGTQITYLIETTNTGNVTLSDLTVTDALDPDFSCEITSLAPGMTDQSCEFMVTVTQEMVDAGSVENTASVTATDPFGTDVGNDVTVVTPGPEQTPSLEATKVVLTPATTVGAALVYQLSVENTGNVSLTPTAIADTFTRSDGTAVALDAPFALASGDDDSDGDIDVGETFVYTATYTITQADLNDGSLSNTVTVSSTDPNGDPVSDVSDNGVDSDGNTEDDPTVFTFAQAPDLTVIKSVATSGSSVGDEVVFSIQATNTGNVDLSDLGITDTLTRLDLTVIETAAPVAVDVPDPLAPGEVAEWQLTHTLTQDDIDAGGISNTATVDGVTPDGTPISDVSADDDTTDGNLDDDPTVLDIAPDAGLTVLKVLDTAGAAAGEDVVFTITAENSGNVTLSDITVEDSLTRLGDGEALTPVTLAFVSADQGSAEGLLQAGETATYSATYTLLQADVDAGGVSNTATVTGTTPLGATVTDISDDDEVGDSDPTVVLIEGVAEMEVRKTAGVPQPL